VHWAAPDQDGYVPIEPEFPMGNTGLLFVVFTQCAVQELCYSSLYTGCCKSQALLSPTCLTDRHTQTAIAVCDVARWDSWSVGSRHRCRRCEPNEVID